MYKVQIAKDGTITRDSEIIANISGFEGSDYVRFPNTYKPKKIKLNTGETVTIVYGGFFNGEFKETCHIKCVWGTHCLQYKKGQCVHCDEFKDVGFYVLD